jgi:hypothetical protein
MKLDEVKRLAMTADLDALRTAEIELTEGNALSLEVHGEDEGEQLTHILSAIWVLEHMETYVCNLPIAMRALTQKVRTSIS